MEVIVHAGCQQQVLIGRMPLQPPHSATRWTLTERLPHVPAIPQQNLLIIATEREAQNTRLTITRLKEGAGLQFSTGGPKTEEAV